MLKDRQEAGIMLAKKLAPYRLPAQAGGTDAVVLGLPRGGVVVAAEISRALQLPLDIVVARKIGHPDNPEYAIGVVDEKGTMILNEEEAAAVDAQWLKDERERQRAEAKRRIETSRGEKNPLELKDKSVNIVDDGIATGLTMRLAVRSVKAHKPRRLIVAVPVAPEGAEGELRIEGADKLITLVPPEEFLGAVGSHYISFPQTTDGEVVTLLHTP